MPQIKDCPYGPEVQTHNNGPDEMYVSRSPGHDKFLNNCVMLILKCMTTTVDRLGLNLI